MHTFPGHVFFFSLRQAFVEKSGLYLQAECADAELKNTERRANETSRRLEQVRK